MKKVLAITAAMVFGIASLSMAGGFDKCKGCHTDAGKPAAGKAALTAKFKTADEFVKAAKASTSPMMKSFANNDAALKAAAEELGLK